MEPWSLAALPPWAGLGLLALAAMVAGVINTMAGGGSLLILPMLVGLGLPAPVANGTLRVGVLVQNTSALIAFHRRKITNYGLVVRLAIPMLAGTAVGTGLATQLSDDVLRPVFGILLALWAVILLLRPGRFELDPDPVQLRQPTFVTYLFALLIGVYGGFIQAGVGFPLLALLVTHLGHPVVRANAVKVGMVLASTLVALPMFALADQVRWREGAAVALGAMIGAWIGTHWQVRSGAKLVRWFLIVMVAVSGGAMIWSGLRS